MSGPSGAATAPVEVDGITFDFGNTLIRVERSAARAVMRVAAEAIAESSRLRNIDAFLDVWAEEQARQFREEVPRGREVDLAERLVRVLARVRGMTAPPPERRWDDAAARTHVEPAEIDAGIEAYAAAFVAGMPPIPGVGGVIERLAGRGFVLGILSNWPLAAVIDRFAAAHGWDRHLRAIVVSQRVGAIKPDPAIYRAAAEAMALPPRALLHVGDDWEADVVGGRSAGWRTAYLLDRQADSPLPASVPGTGPAVWPDLVLTDLEDLEPLVARPS